MGMKKHLPLFVSIFIAGFTALSAQIVFLRELLVLFYGNELALGVVLACWLFWTGVGSLILGRLADRLRSPATIFSCSQALLAFALILTLPAIRSVKLFLDISPGQIVGYVPIFIASFIVVSACCLLNGFLFSLGCRVYERVSREGSCSPGHGLGVVYVLEALGSVAGGFLTSLFLVQAFSPLGLVLIFGFLNLAAAGTLLFFSSPFRRFRFLKALWFVLLAVSVLAGAAGWFGRLDVLSLGWQWRGFRLEKTENTVYGQLAVTGREGQFSLFENGLLLFTCPDLLSAEESVHFAMLEHPDPGRILLIGGGAGGSLREILRHPAVREVTYVELDPEIIRLTEEFLPPGPICP